MFQLPSPQGERRGGVVGSTVGSAPSLPVARTRTPPAAPVPSSHSTSLHTTPENEVSIQPANAGNQIEENRETPHTATVLNTSIRHKSSAIRGATAVFGRFRLLLPRL